MNRVFQVMAIGVIIVAGAANAAFAASAPESVVGTWTLNLEKSKFSPGPAPKSQTRTYAESADGIALTVNGVAADGSPVSQKSTFRYDGKDYAITGSADYDTLAVKRVNGSTIKATQKKDGKVVGSTVRTVSGHGKVLTLTSKGKDAKGAKYRNVMVFDKQ